MKPKLFNQNFIAGFILLLSLVRVLSQALRFDLTTTSIFALSLLTWLVVTYLFTNKRILTGLGLLTSLSLLLALLDPALHRWSAFIKYKNPIQLGLSSSVADLLRLENWPDYMFYISDAFLQGAQVGGQIAPYNIFSIVLFSAIIGSILYVSIQSQRHYGYYLLPLVLYVQQWFQYAEGIQSNFSIYFIGFIILAGSYTRDKTHKASQASEYGLKHFAARRYGTYLFTLALVLMMLSNVVLFFTPVDGINLKVGELVPNILDMRTGYKRQSMALFTFKQTIYHPYDERLGGPVVRNENPVLLRVWSDQAGAYLRGRVKNKYTGSSWVSDNVIFKNNNDYSSVTGIPLTRQASYEMTIVPEGISTKTIFAPLGVKTINLDQSKVFLNPDGAMYYKRESFEGALDVYSIRGVDYSMHMQDRSLYLDLPDRYDERVIEKAKEITQGLESDYEKIEAIKSWLRQKYPYNLEPGLPPADADFVAYFLFEEESGYCTYFASALAIMGRAVGVPTRYVEGFILPNTREPDGSYPVRADRAHAWAEAYIEGEGWRIFEATPAYSGTSGNLNELERQTQVEGSEAVIDDESQFTLDAKENLLDVELSEGSDYVPVNRPDYSKEILAGFIFTLMLVVGLVLHLVLRVRRHFAKGTNKEVAVRHIYYLDDLVNIDNETLTPPEKLKLFLSSKDEFAKNFKEDFKEDFNKSKDPAYDIIDKVNAVLYSNEQVETETLNEIKAFVYQVEHITKGRVNRLRYILDLNK